jgi:hypothetical protein
MFVFVLSHFGVVTADSKMQHDAWKFSLNLYNYQIRKIAKLLVDYEFRQLNLFKVEWHVDLDESNYAKQNNKIWSQLFPILTNRLPIPPPLRASQRLTPTIGNCLQKWFSSSGAAKTHFTQTHRYCQKVFFA